MTQRQATRRRLLTGGGAALLAGLAGCTALGSGDGETTTAATTTANGTATTAEPTTAGSTTTTTEPTTTTAAETTTPHANGEVHLHGTMRLALDGTTYHFGDKPRNMEARTGNPHFHFHTDGRRDRWHVHSRGVTLGYAVDAMPEFDLAAGRVTYRGHAYDDEWPNTSVEVTVNGAPLDDPRGYLLREGDAVLVTVDTDRPTPTPTPGENATAGNGMAGNAAAGSETA